MNTVQLFDKYAQQLQHAVAHYAPQAWTTLVMVNQFDAIAYLLCAFVGFILAGALSLFSYRMGKKANCEWNAPPWWYILCGVAVCGSTAGLLVIVFSPWAWITAFNPQLGTLHQIISAIQAKV